RPRRGGDLDRLRDRPGWLRPEPLDRPRPRGGGLRAGRPPLWAPPRGGVCGAEFRPNGHRPPIGRIIMRREGAPRGRPNNMTMGSFLDVARRGRVAALVGGCFLGCCLLGCNGLTGAEALDLDDEAASDGTGA